MDNNAKIIDFIQETKWDALPERVRHQSLRALLDIFGALIAGGETPVAKLMAHFVTDQMPGRDCTIVSNCETGSLIGAVLSNGFAANALDIDDGHRLVKGHPGACLIPILLAMSELHPRASGKDFLTALVVGYEIGIRAGMIRHAIYPTYHSSGSWGALAGIGAASSLIGLQAGIIKEALGIAEYHAPIAPMMKGIVVPSMVKDSIGWGAMVSICSLEMAKNGFTGINPLFNDSPKQEWINELGSRWRCLDLYFKPYACCRWAQPAIAGALKALGKYQGEKCVVKKICVRTFHEAACLSCDPPKNTEEAQYNLSFNVAAAILDGNVGPKQVLPPRIYDLDIIELMEKIEVFEEPEYQAVFPAQTIARVVVETEDGKLFDSGEVQPRWEPPDSLPTDRELKDKFFELVTPIYGIKKTKSLCKTIWNFHKETSAGDLIHLIKKEDSHE